MESYPSLYPSLFRFTRFNSPRPVFRYYTNPIEPFEEDDFFSRRARSVPRRIPIHSASDDEEDETDVMEASPQSIAPKRCGASQSEWPSSVQEEDHRIEEAILASMEDAERTLQMDMSRLQPLYSEESVEELEHLQENIGRIIHPTAYSTLDKEDIASDNINVFVKLIEYQYGVTVQVMDTYFATYLERAHGMQQDEDGREYCLSQVEKYSARIDWNKKGLVVVPIHSPGHWILATVDLTKMHVEVWDSFACNHSDTIFKHWAEILHDWLCSPYFMPASVIRRGEELGVKCTLSTRDAVHQRYGNDCGAFICFYALQKAKGRTTQEILRANCCTPDYMTSTFRPYMKRVLRPFLQTE